MLLYYRFFHVKRLRYTQSNQPISDRKTANGHLHRPAPPPHCNGLPVPGGVFNCRFNPAMKRKKKKPTSFVPMPVLPSVVRPAQQQPPFWKRPVAAVLPSISSETEGSVCSRGVNIRQKLQEKKQQQMAELRVIEEEIQQGKLQQRPNNEQPLSQPIPRAKKQPWPASRPYLVPPPPPHKQHRAHTPEILLAPRFLDYRDWEEEEDENSSEERRHEKALYKSYRIPSDIDSQISLPRSYTLPREFKYYRRTRSRKIIKSEHFITSNNSSDGEYSFHPIHLFFSQISAQNLQKLLAGWDQCVLVKNPN